MAWTRTQGHPTETALSLAEDTERMYHSTLPIGRKDFARRRPSQPMSTETLRVPVAGGFLGGLTAWVVGFVLVAIGRQATGIGGDRRATVEAFHGSGLTLEDVAWLFYNAHYVDLSVPTGGTYRALDGSANVLLGGFGSLFLLVPPLVLLFAGAVVTRTYRHRLRSQMDAGIFGASVVLGYFVCVLVGVYFFTAGVNATTVRPSPVPAISVAGLGYPIVFGALGGLLAEYVSTRQKADEA